MTNRRKTLLVLTLLAAAYFGHEVWRDFHPSEVVKVSSSSIRDEAARSVDTTHYSISSTATPSETKLVAETVESLYAAYASFFAGRVELHDSHARLKLVLYKDQKEFKAHNHSSPWAEAYYLAPTCYAYFAEGEANPYHWMLHEATHQLNIEVAHFKKAKWVDEGLATYFGTSRIDGGELTPGKIDANTYPLWWLPELYLSGDLSRDIADGRIIPLRTIVSGQGGPDINTQVNLYYIEYWCLSHFLFHFQGGRYAAGYRKLIVAGGSLEDFEKLIGPIDQVQAEWYGYLRQEIIEVRTAGARDRKRR